MKLSRRVVLSLLVAAILLFLALLFWPFVVDNILRPTALVLWLLLRILVLSIHQKYIWFAVLIAAFVVLFRLLPQEQTEIQSDAAHGMNGTMINIRYWRGLFTYNGQTVHDQKALKRQLTYLLTSFYASKHNAARDFRFEEELRQGKVPLPETIAAFLFPPEPTTRGWLRTLFYSLRDKPRKWIRQWTGREKAEHYQVIEEVLRFLESSLEIKHDDTTHSQNKH